MSDFNLFYSSTDGTRDGRASHFFKNQGLAESQIGGQNDKAESMGIKTRYELTTCLDSEVKGDARKSIR